MGFSREPYTCFFMSAMLLSESFRKTIVLLGCCAQQNVEVGDACLSSLDANFMHEVANTSRGRGVLACIQCGRCISSCPVSREVDEHNPRKLMEMIILGLRSDVLSGQLPWYCLSCFTCLDICPQGGDVGETTFAIRNLAIREGNIPQGILAQAQNLFNNGRVVVPTRMALMNRETYALGREPKIDVEAVQRILRKTGFDNLICKGS
jgi:heterodisulfide reductase subunit C